MATVPVPMIIRVAPAPFAADFIAEMTKHEAAQRTGHKADREGGERQHSPDAVVEFREIQMIEDKPRDNAVQEEVIPLYDGPTSEETTTRRRFLSCSICSGFHECSLGCVVAPVCCP